MVEKQNNFNHEHPADAPKLALDEIGAAIRAQIFEACKAHPLWEQLQTRRKSGEIAQNDFGYADVRDLFEDCIPVQRKHIGQRAVVLMGTDIEQMHEFTYVDSRGELQNIDPEMVNGVLILFPEDFGNLPDASTSS
ncbi:MAG: hypothetical protein PHX93_04610 [Candidatus Peribacteraceae bacterium]|jgi:hypothetical protein|nr:hypothetical protein [Candidatus Peribacteraceae bacterium]